MLRFFIFALFVTFSLFAEDEEPIVRRLKGVVLVPSHESVEKGGIFNIRGFRSIGMSVPGGDEGIGEALGEEFIGKPVTSSSLIELKKEILLYYRDQGYPIVVVEVPEQNIKSGVVQIVVVESKLGRLDVRGNKWFSDSFYQGKFDYGKGGSIPAPSLLDDIAWLNRNPFQNANVVFTPGLAPDTTDVDVIIDDAFPLRFYLGGDNTGNSSTQNTRLFGGFNWGWAFFQNHIFSYQYSTSPDFKRFWAHTLNYTMLLPWKNTIVLFGGISQVKPKFDDFEGTGKSFQASFRYQVPFKPLFTSFSHELAAGCDFKRTNNNVDFVPEESLEVIASHVNLFQFLGKYSFLMQRGKDKLSFNAEGYYSPGRWLPGQSNADYSALSFGAKNVYFYTKFAVSYLHYSAYDFNFLWFLRGQASTANLLPSEELGIGGYDTVRGYEERLLNVANGVIFNFEARTPPIPVFFNTLKRKDQVEALLFFDYGGGRDLKTVPGLGHWTQILSVGPGIRYRWDNYVSFRFDWGIQLKRNSLETQNNKVHLGLMLSY